MIAAELQSRLTERIGVRWSEDRLRDLDRFLSTGVDAGDENALAEFMNGETYFFRYPLYLAVLQAMLDRHPAGRPFRVLCAACSSGEEAYSVAFALVDRARESGRSVEIVGSDVRRRAIATARTALYSHWSFRNLPPSERGRYFDSAEAERWRVRDPYRSAVRFVVRNLLEPVEETGYDAVLLCNATLYMEPQASRRVYDTMAACLRPEGLLMLAPTDPPPGTCWTQAVEYGGWSVFRRACAQAAALPAGSSAPPSSPAEDAVAATSPTLLRPAARTPFRSVVSGRRAQVCAAKSPVRAGVRPTTPPPGLSATGSPADALWTAWANGSLGSAQDELRQRIFLEPENPLWRFLHGVVMWEQGWLARASREIERAAQLAAGQPASASVGGLCTAAELRGMVDFWRKRHV